MDRPRCPGLPALFPHFPSRVKRLRQSIVETPKRGCNYLPFWKSPSSGDMAALPGPQKSGSGVWLAALLSGGLGNYCWSCDLSPISGSHRHVLTAHKHCIRTFGAPSGLTVSGVILPECRVDKYLARNH